MPHLAPRLLSLMSAALLLAIPAHAAKPPTFAPVDSPLVTKAPIATDFVMGHAEAPVILIEYASFSCPHCARFHKKELPILIEEYVKTGKMRYILRPFPLNDPALKASLLVDCVGEQSGPDRYYTFARALFDAQDKWAFETNWMSALSTFARVGGVGPEQFDQCITDTRREVKVLNIKRDGGKELKVNHTPYFFINGYRYDDAPSAAKMKEVIDQVLAGKVPQQQPPPSGATAPPVSPQPGTPGETKR